MPASHTIESELAGLGTLPSGWSYRALSDLMDDTRGIAYGIVQPGSAVSGGVPVVRVQDIRQGTILTDDALRVADEIDRKYRRTRLRGGELLITLVGTIGQAAVVPFSLAGWNVARAIGVVPVRPDIGAKYVMYALRLREIQDLLLAWCNTTVQATLNLKELARVPIPVAPRKERERIVALFGALDDKIVLNSRLNHTLETVSSALFRSWFVDFDPVIAKANGRRAAGVPLGVHESLPGRFEGDLPAGWRLAEVSESIEFNPSRSLGAGMMAPHLEMAATPTRGHAPEQIEFRLAGSGARFVNGDTLLARITPCLENGKTAFVDFLKPGQVGWGSTEFIVMRPRPHLPPQFAYCLARLPEFRDQAERSMSGSSGRQRVAVDAVKRFRFVDPPAGIARAWGNLVTPLFLRVRANVDENRTLSAIRDTLLPEVFSGAIRLHDAERMVVASV